MRRIPPRTPSDTAAVAAAEAAAASASHYPQIVGGVWYVWSPTAGEYISTGIDAQGEDGVSPTVEITAIQGGHRVVITDAEGSHTFDVMDGVTPDLSAYRTAADQDEIDDAQDEELNNLKSALDTKAGIIRDTASGSVASFVPDATIDNLLGLSVALEPIQDLHGYDSPWPAGGGKNLFDASSATFKKWQLLSNAFKTRYDMYSGIAVSVDGDTVTVTTTGAYLGIGFELSASASVRTVSISGSANQIGFYSAYEDGATQLSYGATSCSIPADTAGFVGVRFNAVGTYTLKIQLESGSTATAWTPYSNICPISGRDSVDIMHSGADTSNPTTYTIQLGDTVYGGTLDVTAGTLTVDKAMVDMGSLNWAYYSNVTRFAVRLNDGKYSGTGFSIADECFCSCYPALANQRYASQPDKSVTVGSSFFSTTTCAFVVHDSNYTDANTFKTAVTGQQLVYELATPIVIDLDPVQIATIANQTNNVWADAGDVSVEFAADLKTYIDNKIAAAVAALS